MTDKMEDSVAFLDKLREVYPDVTALLNSVQLLGLDMKPMEAFPPSDINPLFVKIAQAYFVTKHSIDVSRDKLRSYLIEPRIKSEEIDVENEQRVIECLTSVMSRIKLICDSKLKLTEELHGESGLPRIIRLSNRLKLSDKEKMVMIYTMVHSCQVDDTKFTSGFFRLLYGADTLSVCKACDIEISEMISFLNQDREHMQQGIFPGVEQSHLLHSSLKIDEVSCRALVGAPLTANEFLEIESTHLADIIAAEKGNEHFRVHDTLEMSLSAAPSIRDPPLPPEEHKDSKELVPQSPLPNTEMVLDSLTGDIKQDEIPSDAASKHVNEGNKELDLDQLLRNEREKEKQLPTTNSDQVGEHELSSDKLKPYKTDLEYLDDYFQLVAQKLKVYSMENQMEMVEMVQNQVRDTKTLRQKREAEVKTKVYERKCEKRLALTKKSGAWIPRFERMVASLGLCTFEKNVLITVIGVILQPNKMGRNRFSVGKLLRLFCNTLKDQIHHRMFFYKSATLVREGMIIVHNSSLIGNGDLTSSEVEIDRRMLDFCVGLDTEFSEIVEGSHLYYPKTSLDQVILNKEQKQLILNTVSNFDTYRRCRKQMGLGDIITYGAGMVLLFHGAPGTGKTMMANALANKLNKKVLLINFPSLGKMSAGENFKFVFREAKISDAILFFDECEAIFETREKGSHNVNMLLTEIERHDGLIIMATNRPYDLDEAMHRRIMLAMEFRKPDHLLRKAIWESQIPSQMKMADDVDLNELSLRFELTGGFIKNAILSALSIAVSRDGEYPIVCQKDLFQGATLQLRGRLRMKDFHRRVVPKASIDRVVVSKALSQSLMEIVQFEKAGSVLFGQWGFGEYEQQGITVLFHGPPGTGKSLAAEALGYEVGKPLKVVNCGELLSKWVGESTKNINAIFEEARYSDAILVFDEAEGLFGARTPMTSSVDRYANVDVGVLLYHIERFPGIIILTTNLIDNIDKAFFRRLKFVLAFDTPTRELRLKIWKLLIPEETPLAEDVEIERLARKDMSGGSIKSAIFRAASRAALRTGDDHKLTMKDLEDSVEEEFGKTSTRPRR